MARILGMLKPKFHSIFDKIAIGMQMLSDNLVKEDEVVSNIKKDNQDNVPPPSRRTTSITTGLPSWRRLPVVPRDVCMKKIDFELI